MTNAAKYGHAGRTVEIRVHHGPAASAVHVLDRGPGVDPLEISRLFEIDFRSPFTEGLAQGSGIGLFVARWLVASMGGEIWAKRRDGGGSEFGFSLPNLGEGAADEDPEPATLFGPGEVTVLELPLG